MNCIKKLPWSAGKYIDTRKYYPQDRVYCDGSVYVSLVEQIGNKPSFTVNSDGTYTVSEGWMLLAPGMLDKSENMDYPSLTGKPSINGVVLEGDKTPEDLGLMTKDGAYTKVEADGRFETKARASETFQTKEKATADLASVTKALDGCAKKTELPSKTSQLTNDSGFIDSTALAPYAKTGDVNAELKKKADKADVEPYDISWIGEYLSGNMDIPEDKYNEIKKALDDNRQLVIKRDNALFNFYGCYNSETVMLYNISNNGYVDGVTAIAIFGYYDGDKALRHVMKHYKELPLEPVSNTLIQGNEITYVGDVDKIYSYGDLRDPISKFTVTCSQPAKPLNKYMVGKPKTREAKFIFLCGSTPNITFNNVIWDGGAPDFNNANQCICEISIMYVYPMNRFFGKYTIYPRLG